MSNLDTRPTAQVLGGLGATTAGPVLDLLPGKQVLLGESTRVRRLLPTLGRRLVGAWAFVDHYGPDDVAAGAGMQVAPLERGAMLYLGTGRRSLRLSAAEASRLLLLGGEPFDEQLVMWWNFVGRSGAEIADYAEQWNAESQRFGTVVGFDGARLEAPPLPPVPLKARGRQR